MDSLLLPEGDNQFRRKMFEIKLNIMIYRDSWHVRNTVQEITGYTRVRIPSGQENIKTYSYEVKCHVTIISSMSYD